MKKVLDQLATPIDDGFAAKFKEKSLKFIKEHPELFCLSLLAIACLLFLFFGLGFYPLIDVDETRYAVIARDLIHSFDWNSLNLNAVPFLEKPPLYFWIVGASIKFFHSFSSFAVRLPIAMLSTFIVFFTYYVGKRIISRKYGMISALILLSSIFFLILSHIAILDMVLTVFVTSAIYCALLTDFCEEKNKKYYWWYFYLFIGLGFLSKGLLALVLPFVVVLPYRLITRTAKDLFRPINLLPGLAIFFAISLPWHIIMYKEYGFEFIKQYFLIHHFARFINSANIGRERPFLYFVPVFLLGFFPWSLVFIAFVVDVTKKMIAKYKDTEGKIKEKVCSLFETSTNEQKLLVFLAIYFVVVFLLFSISSTKLPTYILPVFPAAALLTGYYWWVSDEKDGNRAEISAVTHIFSAFFIFGAAIMSFSCFFLPYNLQSKLAPFEHQAIIALYMLGIFLLLRLNTKRALSIFSGYVFVMLFIIMLAVSNLFNFVYSTGENEIVNYSRVARVVDASLVTFDFSVKPSVMIDYNRRVDFITAPDFEALDKALKSNSQSTFVIVKNKNFKGNEEYKKKLDDRLKLIRRGIKYSLYGKVVKNDDVFLDFIMLGNGENTSLSGGRLFVQPMSNQTMDDLSRKTP